MVLIDRRQGLWLLAGSAAATMALGVGAAAQAVSPHERILALIEKGAGRIAFYALPDGKRVGALPLGTQPHEIAADTAGRFAYVGHYGVESWKAPGAGGSVVWVIDLHNQTLVRTIDMSPFGRLHAARTDTLGRLYVVSEKDSVLARFDDPVHDQSPSRLIPVGGARSHYLVVRRDGTRCYVADTLSGAVIVVDPDDMGVSPVRKRIGTAPEGMTLSADEGTLYVIDRPSGTIHALDAETLEDRARRPMRGEAVRIVTQPEGCLIVSNVADKSLSRLDPVTLVETDRLQLEAGAPGLNLAGDMLYASMENDRVVIIDTRKWAITGSFATGSAPDAGIIISRAP